MALGKFLTQSESPSFAPEVETECFTNVTIKCIPMEISRGGAWKGSLCTEATLLRYNQTPLTSQNANWPDVAGVCKEDSQACALPRLQPGYQGTRPAAGMNQDPIGFLAQPRPLQESNIALPGTILYNWIRLRPLPRMEPRGTC